MNELPDIPSLGELLTALTPGGAAVGGWIGLFLRNVTLREMFNNATLGAGVGGLVGTTLALIMAFVRWVA